MVFFVLCERRVVNAVSAVSGFLRFRCGVVSAVSAVSAFLPLPVPQGKIINLAREHRATFSAEKDRGVTKKEPSNRGLLSLWVFTNNVALFLVPILTSSRLNLRSTMIKRAYHSSHSVQSSWVLRT